MEFLDMNSFETIYSEPNKPEDSENNKSTEVVSIIERALSTTDNITLKQFAEGLEGQAGNIFVNALSSKTSDLDKGLITALLKKYPKLKIKEIQQLDFKNHVSNLVDSGKLSDGGLKYLVERLLEIDRVKKMEEQQQEEEDQNEQGQPQNEQGGDEEPSQEAPQAQESQDTQNSDFYSEWDRNFNNTDTPLTEEDFNDMIDYQEVEGYLKYPSNHRTSSEYKKNNPITLADKFLSDKKTSPSKESTYTSLMRAEDFILGKILETKYDYYDLDAIIDLQKKTAPEKGYMRVSWFENKHLNIPKSLYYNIVIPLKEFKSGFEEPHGYTKTSIRISFLDPKDEFSKGSFDFKSKGVETTIYLGSIHNRCRILNLTITKKSQNLYSIQGKIDVLFSENDIAESEHFKFKTLLTFEGFTKKDTRYSSGKNALIGTGVGALVGTGVGYLAGSKNRSESKDLKEKYQQSEHKLDKLKAKVVKLKAKGGLSIEDQKQISRLKSEVASLNNSSLLSSEDRGELQRLRSKLGTLETSGSVTRGFTKNKFFKGASHIAESYGRQDLDAKIARLESKGQAQAQAKARILAAEANERSSKLKLSPEDQEKLQKAISKRRKIKELKERSESLKSASTRKMIGFGALGAGAGALTGYKVTKTN